MYRTFARPLAFALPPETSHRLAVNAFRVRALWRAFGRIAAPRGDATETRVAGLALPNPVGLAAGFDKDCVALGSLLDIGFGYVVGGTVTLQPRTGNARPRMFRNAPEQALVNALGFPGRGLDQAEARLKPMMERDRQRVLVSISGTKDDEILACHGRLEPLVAAIEVNISSPNTAGLAVYHEAERLRPLVSALAAQKAKPLLLKLPRLPETESVVELATAALEAGADGVVAANTRPVSDRRLAVGRGGLSGEPLFASTLELVRAIRAAVPEEPCGGVMWWNRNGPAGPGRDR